MLIGHLHIFFAYFRSLPIFELGYFLFLFLINSFIFYLVYFWLRWVFIAARGLSLVVARGGYSCCSVWASYCGGFSCCGARALGKQAQLWLVGSVVVARGL